MKAAPPGALSPGSSGNRGPAIQPLNEALPFVTFLANHPVGSEFDGVVTAFTSHGAHVDVDGMLCHVPLKGLGQPAPVKARTVLTKGETRRFVLRSVDAPHRRAEIFLAGVDD